MKSNNAVSKSNGVNKSTTIDAVTARIGLVIRQELNSQGLKPTPRNIKQAFSRLIEYGAAIEKKKAAPQSVDVWKLRNMRSTLTRSADGTLTMDRPRYNPHTVTLKESLETFIELEGYEADGMDYGDAWNVWLGDIAKAL